MKYYSQAEQKIFSPSNYIVTDGGMSIDAMTSFFFLCRQLFYTGRRAQEDRAPPGTVNFKQKASPFGLAFLLSKLYTKDAIPWAYNLLPLLENTIMECRHMIDSMCEL